MLNLVCYVCNQPSLLHSPNLSTALPCSSVQDGKAAASLTTVPSAAGSRQFFSRPHALDQGCSRIVKVSTCCNTCGDADVCTCTNRSIRNSQIPIKQSAPAAVYESTAWHANTSTASSTNTLEQAPITDIHNAVWVAHSIPTSETLELHLTTPIPIPHNMQLCGPAKTMEHGCLDASTPWPPLTLVRVLLAHISQSCSTACCLKVQRGNSCALQLVCMSSICPRMGPMQ